MSVINIQSIGLLSRPNKLIEMRRLSTLMKLGALRERFLKYLVLAPVSFNSTGKSKYHEAHSGDNLCPSMIRGIDFIRDPRLNKGMAFSLEERQVLGIHGLLPPRFKSQTEQVKLCVENLRRYEKDINKYVYLMGLQDRNERLFYKLLAENVEELMPIVYTPTVGLACQTAGLIYRRPRGLFITIYDRGFIYDILRNWPEKEVRAIVVTDGERILGLGDLGTYGMGIPVGKLALYTALAGIQPHQCLPIILDVGTNTERLIDDPFYIGIRQKRIVGQEYDDFIQEFMEAVVKRYGQNTLIQFEDFGQHNAFRILEKYRNKFCTFNDDIQGTAAVALAGMYASLRLTGKKLSENKFLFLGAGQAAFGIAQLLHKALVKDGMSEKDAAERIFLYDINGLIVKSRNDVSTDRAVFAKDMEENKDFENCVERIKPTAIIGASAQRGAFSKAILAKMGKFNDRPLIFALSNPTSKAECTAEDAYVQTEGRAIFSSGSPFPNFELNGKKFEPGQGNNAYIFPGVALGVIAAGLHHISDDIFLLASQSLASQVKESDLAVGRLYPPIKDIHSVSFNMAKIIIADAYKQGLATFYPEPKDLDLFLKTFIYDFEYDDDSSIPQQYPWPDKFQTHECSK